MPRLIQTVAVVAAVFGSPAGMACTIFYAYDGKVAMGGNNEDWKDPETFMWFKPGGEGEYGRVIFGFGNAWPQGGVNEKGLFFDAAATQRLPLKQSAGKPRCPHDILDKLLRECATVDEAVALFERYSMPFMERAIFLFGDRQGSSAIYEGDEIIRGNRRYQILTNYYQSRQTPKEAGCRRMQTAQRIFAERFGQDQPLTVELMKAVLEAVHQEGKYGTKYSNVYDLTHGDVYLYCNHDFDVVVKFNIAQELAKGARKVALPSWFLTGKSMDFTRTGGEAKVETSTESTPKETPPREAKDRENGDDE
jgi:hypothetical protein